MKLQESYGNRGLKLVMAAGEPIDQIKADLNYGKAPVTVLGNAEALVEKYDVANLPHLFYFDRKGHVALEIEGYSPELMEQLEKRVAADLRAASARLPVERPVLARR